MRARGRTSYPAAKRRRGRYAAPPLRSKRVRVLIKAKIFDAPYDLVDSTSPACSRWARRFYGAGGLLGGKFSLCSALSCSALSASTSLLALF